MAPRVQSRGTVERVRVLILQPTIAPLACFAVVTSTRGSPTRAATAKAWPAYAAQRRGVSSS